MSNAREELHRALVMAFAVDRDPNKFPSTTGGWADAAIDRVISKRTDVVLRFLAESDDGPSLISEHLLYEDGPEDGPIVQTWEWIKPSKPDTDEGERA